MNDLELTKACAGAMDFPTVVHEHNEHLPSWSWSVQIQMREGGFTLYDPLHDDAQAMALVRTLRLCIIHDGEQWQAGSSFDFSQPICDADLNRAICRAAMQSSKPEG